MKYEHHHSSPVTLLQLISTPHPQKPSTIKLTISLSFYHFFSFQILSWKAQDFLSILSLLSHL